MPDRDILRQLLYVSIATKPMDEVALQDLLAEARSLNAEHGITGALVYVPSCFIQCIEGPSQKIGQLSKNIETDSRNTSFHVLFDKKIGTRNFPDWTMAFRVHSTQTFATEQGFVNLTEKNCFDKIREHHQQVFETIVAYHSSI